MSGRVMDGHLVKADKNLHNGGRAPLGYDVDSEGNLVINKYEAVIIQKIFEGVANGYSYEEIADELNTLGYKTKAGNSFTKGSFYDLINNEKYCGTYVYNKTAKKKWNGKRNKHKYKNESEIIRHENAIPAIISKETFEKVQKICKERKERRGACKAKRTYLLSGLIKCGYCGSNMQANTSSNSRGYESSSYRCGCKCSCKNPQVEQRSIETYVLTLLERSIFDETKITMLLKGVNAYFLERDGRNADEYKKLCNLIKANVRSIDNLANAIAKGANVDVYDKKISTLRSENERLTQKRDSLSLYSQKFNVTEDMLKKFIKDFANRVRSRNKADCKRFIGEFVESVKVYSDKIEVNLRLSDKAGDYVITKDMNRQFLPKVK